MFFSSVTTRNYLLFFILFITLILSFYSIFDLKKRWKILTISLVMMIVSLIIYYVSNFYVYGCKWKCKKQYKMVSWDDGCRVICRENTITVKKKRK